MDLETLRHSCSHVLAAAVKELFPKVKLGIGPSIEDGFYYDFDIDESFTPGDLKKIEKKMQEIINKGEKFIKVTKTKAEAKKLLKDEPYKLELLKEIDEPTFYKTGKFIDLCSGPHTESTKEIKAFKLLKIAGAYWKGDSKNKQLQRIYGTTFLTKKELDEYLYMLEEAEKRNHVLLGKQLDLFTFHEEGPGFPFWHPKGTVIYNELKEFAKEENKKRSYNEIITPIILNKSLWVTSGHWDKFRDDMYFIKIDKKDYAIKPMSCPGGLLIYKTKIHSYRELPLRNAEFGLVHRHELSGVLHGLFRVRAFTQDDAHSFCTEEQLKDEIIDMIEYAIDVYGTLGFKEYVVNVATRPKKFIGEEKAWEKATNILKMALDKKKIKYSIKEGEGAFYGPKIDFNIKDALKRNWQCGTIQVDFSMPKRFNVTYEGKDGQKHTPIMVHRAILGSLERMIGIIIEHYSGKLPLWLSPVQIKLMTVTDKNIDYAKKIKEELEKNGIRVELDIRPESISKKVRDAQVVYIPLMVTVGDKEEETDKLAVRTLDGKVFNVNKKDFIKETIERINKRC